MLPALQDLPPSGRGGRLLTLVFVVYLLLCDPASRAAAQARVVGDTSGIVPDTLTLGPDGKRFTFVAIDGRTKSRRVIVDGKPMGKLYDSIAKGSPLFSLDGQRIAFVGKRGPRCYVVLDGVESEGYLLVRDGWPIADVAFSPHGKYLAYKARVEGRTAMIVNGESFGPYEVSVDAEGNRLWGIYDFQFSPDGEYFAYRVKVAGDKMALHVGKVIADPNKKDDRLSISPPYDSIGRGTPIAVPGQGPNVFGFIAVKGGKEYVALWTGQEVPLGGKYDAIARGSVVRSPYDPRRLDYVAKKDGKWVVVAAGKEEPPCDEVGRLMHSPDGRHAYLARKGKNVVLMLQGVEGPPHEGISYPATVFSPNGQFVAYAARSAGSSTAVVNGKPGPSFGRIDAGSLTFSPDSKHFAYAASRAGKHVVVLDAKPGPEFESVSDLRFSPDSARFSYHATKGLDYYLVLDDQLLGPFAGLSSDSPAFSADNKRVAYAAVKDGDWRVFLDSKPLPACDGVVSRLTFSQDGFNHLAYVARYLDDKGRDVVALVANGKAGKRYDTIWMGEGGRLYLDPAGPSEVFATKGLILYRDTVAWPHLLLSDLKYLKGTSGQDAPQLDRSTAKAPLLVLGRQYARGIGTHSPSEIVYDLAALRPKGARFIAVAGIDDGGTGSVVFQVYADEAKLAESPLLRRGAVHRFNVPLPATAKQLRLVVTDGGDGNVGDWADWTDAGLIFDGPPSERPK